MVGKVKSLLKYRGEHVKLIEKLMVVGGVVTGVFFIVDFLMYGYKTAIWKIPNDLVLGCVKLVVAVWIGSLVLDVRDRVLNRKSDVWGDSENGGS